MKAQKHSFASLWFAPLSALLLTAAPFSHAGTVYQYIDENGAMTFSDSPPTHTRDYLEVDLPEPPQPDPTETEQSIEDMVEVTEKLEAQRRQDEEERLQQQDAENAPPEAEYYPEPQYDEDGGYYYPGYYGNRPGRPYDPTAVPPHATTLPADAAEKKRQEMRVPMKIPPFGASGSTQNNGDDASAKNRRSAGKRAAGGGARR